MLQNEPQEEAQTIPALPPGQRRVTPEELTAALEALESGRQEQARHLQETVAIGDVVQELGLDVTPEEVWQQVQAQRAKKPAPPPAAETKLADTVNETLHTAAQQAHKLASQASAAAAATYVAAQVQPSAVRRPRRRGFVLAAVILLAVAGPHWLRGGHEAAVGSGALVLSGDNSTVTYGGYHKAVVVRGDGETVTLRGDCGSLVVSGDHDRIQIIGKVDRVVDGGDGDTITWTQEPANRSTTVVDNGDGDHIGPALAGPQ